MKKEEKSIEDLPGVGAATAEKMREAGYNTLMAIAVASPGELVETVGTSEAVARKIINAARNNLEMGFMSGEELLQKRDKVIKISTGSKAFDAMVGGGFESSGITECYGQYGSGKCCHKDTPVLYFNSSKPHLESMKDIYEKYKNKFGERQSSGGYVVDVPPVVVMGFKGNTLDKVQASFIYREKVKHLYRVQTMRGRELYLTGPHKLLSFKDGLQWTPSAALEKGGLIAYPKIIASRGECEFDDDDAYFLGIFVAEGSRHGPRLTNGSEKIKEWLCAYVGKRFGFTPTTRWDEERHCYDIYLRSASKQVLGDLADCVAETKFVPPALYHAPENVVASFLAGYIDGNGHFGKGAFEATTKSKSLAEGLSYLFLRLGVSLTMKRKIVDGETFWRVSTTSEDSPVLNSLPCKIKSCAYTFRNTRYGYSGNIIAYLRKTYKETLGDNRGLHRKRLGKKNIGAQNIFYHYLTHKAMASKSMNEKTLAKIYDLFAAGQEDIRAAISLCRKLEDLDKQAFRELHVLLPFPFSSIYGDLGLSRTTLSNYTARGLPRRTPETIATMKKVLLERLETIDKKITLALGTIQNVAYFNWDTIDSIEKVVYDDYVYDFVVPEGHCFVGGNMPTLLHNTALGHQLAINALGIDENGDPTACTVWIDTENTFRPERIKQVCENNGLDMMKVLRNIKVVRAFNSDHQMMCAEKVEDLITKDKVPVRLVIVDSLMAHFRSEFIGRGTLADRQQKVNKHMHVLLRLADSYNLVVYVTNQVMAKPDTFFGDPTEAIGGNIVGHNSTTRCYLRRGKKGTRVAKLVDSPYLPDGEAAFEITDKGIVDVK